MNKQITAIVRGLLVTLLTVLSACSSDPDNPEQQIREMISAGEEAVEARSIMTVLDFIADDYQDKSGRQKKDIQRIVAGYILRNKSIHLLTRVRQVELSEDKAQADVILYVGMAGVPVNLFPCVARSMTRKTFRSAGTS